MRLVVDECVAPSVTRWLRDAGHDVLSIVEAHPGIGDVSILELAVAEERILLTQDKDFGTVVFRDGKRHGGIILLRLGRAGVDAIKEATLRGIRAAESNPPGVIVVVTRDALRISQP